MSEHDPDAVDDLGPWADDDLVRALRAPGLESELAEQERYVDAFRAAAGAVTPLGGARSRRTARRLGAGGTAVVAVVALSTSVAAAYTGNLPDPVQQIAHSVIGAPAPEPDVPAARGGSHPDRRGGPSSPGSTPAPTTTSPSPQPGAGATASPSGAAATGTASSAPTGAGRRASGSATPNPSGSAAPSAGPTAAAPDPAAVVSLASSSPVHLVGYGTTVTFTGHVAASDGSVVPGHPLTLQVRGPDGWSRVLRTTTDSGGDAVAQSLPVTGLQRYRWGAGKGLRSPGWRVRVKPTLDASYALGDGSLTVTTQVVGAAAGDQVLLVKARSGKVLGQATVDDAGVAWFDLPAPKRRRTFVAWLPPTRDHAGARDRVVVRRTTSRPASTPTTAASPSP